MAEMHDELERAIRELEAKLPELRRLIAESELTFTLSPDAEAAGRRLLDAIAEADDTAGALRRLLLDGTPSADSSPDAPLSTAHDHEQGIQAARDLERVLAELERRLGLGPEQPPAESEEKPRIVGLTAEYHLPFTTDLWKEFPEREPILPGWDVRKMFQVTPGDGRYLLVLDERSRALAPEAPVEPAERQAWLDSLILVLGFDTAESRAAYLETVVAEAREERDRQRLLKPSPEAAPPVGDWRTPQTFAELREQYREGLTQAVRYFLEDDDETAVVVRQTFEQAERVFDASEGEVSALELLARTARFQIGLLLPRPEDKPERWVPTEEQLFRQLEAFRIERRIAEMEARIAALTAQARESGDDVSQRLAQMEYVRDSLLQQFYNAKLRLDDGEAGGAVGVPVVVPPPQRGPGGGRTFEEALAAPRNP